MLAHTAIGASCPGPDETYILIISPHGWLANIVQRNLNAQGKSLHWATTKQEAIICLTNHTYNLCVLDASTFPERSVQKILQIAESTMIRPRLCLIGVPQESEEFLTRYLWPGDEIQTLS